MRVTRRSRPTTTLAALTLAGLASCGGGSGGSMPDAAPAATTGAPAPDVAGTGAAVAVRLDVVQGDAQVGEAGASLPLPLVVRTLDASGAPLRAVAVSFQVRSGDGQVQVTNALTDADGHAEAGLWQLSSRPGLHQAVVDAGRARLTFVAIATGPARASGTVPPLAVVSTRDGNAEIYRVGFDGGDLRRLTDHPAADRSPAWSPDGGEIAFVSDRDRRPAIHVMRADGSAVRAIAPGGGGDPGWSPDGALIVFSNGAIATVPARGGSVSALTSRPGYHGMPAWSPDGSELALVSDALAYDIAFDLYTMRSDGSAITLRSKGDFGWPNIHLFLHPAWSPDGSLLAYVQGRVINADDVRFWVALMTADGRHIKDLAWAGDIPWKDLLDPGALSWSPDGRGIAYTRVECDLLRRIDCVGRRSVRYVSLDGSVERLIVENASDPSWHP